MKPCNNFLLLIAGVEDVWAWIQHSVDEVDGGSDGSNVCEDLEIGL